jgi:hypothetical protein
MTGADRTIRWSTAAAVIGVAVVAAVVSYEHAYELVHGHGETGWTAHLIPLDVDGLIWASSMALLDSARRGVRVPTLARWLLPLWWWCTAGVRQPGCVGQPVTVRDDHGDSRAQIAADLLAERRVRDNWRPNAGMDDLGGAPHRGRSGHVPGGPGNGLLPVRAWLRFLVCEALQTTWCRRTWERRWQAAGIWTPQRWSTCRRAGAVTTGW